MNITRNSRKYLIDTQHMKIYPPKHPNSAKLEYPRLALHLGSVPETISESRKEVMVTQVQI